jgi:hypothetical protein
MRVSGKSTEEENYPYAKKTADGWEIDTDAIDRKVDEYICEAAAADRYSVSGLCIALGITRDTLELWRAGYISAKDEADKRIEPNPELAASVSRGELFIHRYWEESDKSTTLHTKFLESAGVLDKKSAGVRPPFDLGSLKKYAK